ncbi:MAG: hypothetical protein AAB420_01565 [Patescibacteria group bacterium]
MTELSDHDLNEFIRLWKKEFGEDLPLEQARLVASQLLELYGELAKVADKPDVKRP